MTAQRAAPWQDRWFADGTAQQSITAWRGVEAQHVVSTMRLVDTLAEQEELERLLERSKPAQTTAAQGRHCLLSTPFRYRPLHGSRFRRAGERGIWYGATTLRTATAEVAYWRWRFLMDSVGLAQQALHTEHTFFEAQVQGLAIDLTAAPWARNRAAWVHNSDYGATQALAAAARKHKVQWIRYESVRDRAGPDGPMGPIGTCAAVLEVEALSAAQPLPQQTWHCKTTRRTVLMVHGSDRFSWEFP